jgi:hypothetical protein
MELQDPLLLEGRRGEPAHDPVDDRTHVARSSNMDASIRGDAGATLGARSAPTARRLPNARRDLHMRARRPRIAASERSGGRQRKTAGAPQRTRTVPEAGTDAGARARARARACSF